MFKFFLTKFRALPSSEKSTVALGVAKVSKERRNDAEFPSFYMQKTSADTSFERVSTIDFVGSSDSSQGMHRLPDGKTSRMGLRIDRSIALVIEATQESFGGSMTLLGKIDDSMRST
jgi:hypothetical protein